MVDTVTARNILALEYELANALDLIGARDEIHDDWRTQYVAERAIERVVEAALVLGGRAEDYFGEEGIRRLTVIRDRIGRLDPDVDEDLLHDTIAVDLRIAYEQLIPDATVASDQVYDQLAADDEDASLRLTERLRKARAAITDG